MWLDAPGALPSVPSHHPAPSVCGVWPPCWDRPPLPGVGASCLCRRRSCRLGWAGWRRSRSWSHGRARDFQDENGESAAAFSLTLVQPDKGAVRETSPGHLEGRFAKVLSAEGKRASVPLGPLSPSALHGSLGHLTCNEDRRAGGSGLCPSCRSLGPPVCSWEGSSPPACPGAHFLSLQGTGPSPPALTGLARCFPFRGGLAATGHMRGQPLGNRGVSSAPQGPGRSSRG